MARGNHVPHHVQPHEATSDADPGLVDQAVVESVPEWGMGWQESCQETHDTRVEIIGVIGNVESCPFVRKSFAEKSLVEFPGIPDIIQRWLFAPATEGAKH